MAIVTMLGKPPCGMRTGVSLYDPPSMADTTLLRVRRTWMATVTMLS
ncbi:MAG: hypothetical protein WCO42_02565 [bacterium]